MIRTAAVLLAATLLFLGSQDLGAQISASEQGTPVQRIRADPASFLDRQVTVVGRIIRYVDTGSLDTASYYIEDDFGVQIRVLTRDGLPPVDSRRRVEGIIALDSREDPYLVEASRIDPDASSQPEDPPLSTEGDLEQGGANIWSAYVPIGLGVFLLLGISGWFIMRRPDYSATQALATPDGGYPGGGSSAPLPPIGQLPDTESSDEDFYDGKTVRFHRPSPQDGTLKLLPGRLEILTGPDRGNEVRFIHTGGDDPQITFGRSDGPKFRHVQLTAPTVSRRHALIRFDDGEWSIANFSETNPVLLNGSPLLTVGQADGLKDGDTLEFGEVAFKFHTR